MITTVPTNRQKHASRRLNIRVLVISLVLLAPVAWIVYTFAIQSLGSGIVQVGDYKEVNLKAMGNFAFDDYSDDVNQIPQDYRDLDKQKVLLIGEMYSDSSAGSATDFQLVYSIAKCCFGGPPKVQERVFAHMPQGKRVPIYGGLSKVYGTLQVRPIKQGATVTSVYDLDVERIEQYR